MAHTEDGTMGAATQPKTRIRLSRVLLAIAVLLTVCAAALVATHQRELRRLPFVLSLFSGAEQVENFRAMNRLFSSAPVRRSGPAFRFKTRLAALPETYVFEGETRSLEAFLAEVDTTGMLVVKEDVIVSEEYFLGNRESSQCLSWSVAKSLTSALVGIAVEEGLIRSIEEPVTAYVPELKGSGYDGVRIKDILQMSSGVEWNEDYSDFNSDINRIGRTYVTGSSFDDLVASMDGELEPGTFNRYVSMDTQALGMLLVRATGKSLAAYTEEKLWSKIGAEYDAYWLTDDGGMEWAFGGFNAALRDYAKLGRLYLHHGNWNGEQVVPARWVLESVTPDAPHLLPGRDNPHSDYHWGYGYQWWIPPDPDGEFMAVGVYNQFIYVYPKETLVIAKTSANHNYGIESSEAYYREDEHIAMFRAIAAHLRTRSATASTHQEAGVAGQATDDAARAPIRSP
jgi:CubicO group peptidase (beta-lactamase class C family)